MKKMMDDSPEATKEFLLELAELYNDDPVEKILNWLDCEIERHKEAENAEATSWGRGFHNGSMTECLLIKTYLRSLGGEKDGNKQMPKA